MAAHAIYLLEETSLKLFSLELTIMSRGEIYYSVEITSNHQISYMVIPHSDKI